MRQSKLPRQIWALGMVSLLMDFSSESIHALLPVFLVSVLGASVTSVGVLEGLAEGMNFAFKVISGPLSDWFQRRKPLVIAGYSIAAFSKPLFALANSVGMVYFARLFDRVGKGIRGAPRDALVADLAPANLRGEAFGLRQSMDTIGAILGPIAAIFLMWLSGNNYRLVFWFAAIPALICVVVLFFGVNEPEVQSSVQQKRIAFADIKKFSPAFWFVAVAGAVFQLARFSEAFLILRTKEAGLTLALSPLVLIAMNVVYALTSYPIGYLSDRIKRETFLLIGLVVLFASDLVLAWSSNLVVLFVAIALWGLHMGLTQGVLAAMVTDNCPPNLRGTAFGLFNLLSAVALLIASGLAGYLWDQSGSQTTFLTGAAISLVSLVLFSIKSFNAAKSNG